MFRQYTKMKDSGVEWLGEIPTDWSVVPVKHFVSIPMTDGPHETPEFLDEGVPFVSAEAVWGGRINLSSMRGFISPEAHKRYAQKYLPRKDDIFMVKSGATTGKVAIVDFDDEFNVWSPLAAIRCDRQMAIPKFVFHALGSMYFQDLVQVSWSFGTQQNIGMGVIENLGVVLPPIVEQQVISTFLDRKTALIDDLIAKRERQIELLQEQRTAIISRAVTKGLNPEVPMKDSGVEWMGEVPKHWAIKALKWESPVYRGASPRPIDNPIYFDDQGEYAWVRISDVTSAGMYLENTEQRLSSLGSSFSVKLDPGEIFLSIAGSVGKPCITRIKCCIHDGFVYFPKWKGNTKFLYYVFASGEPYKGLGKMGTQLNLNTDTVGAIILGVPGIKEQGKIVDYIDREKFKIDTSVSKVRQSIEKLREYRQSLISAAVTGKIDVRNWKPSSEPVEESLHA